MSKLTDALDTIQSLAPKLLTPEQKAALAYLDHGYPYCAYPDCNSDDIKQDRVWVDGNWCSQKCHCNKCGRSFTDIYTLAGVDFHDPLTKED